MRINRKNRLRLLQKWLRSWQNRIQYLQHRRHGQNQYRIMELQSVRCLSYLPNIGKRNQEMKRNPTTSTSHLSAVDRILRCMQGMNEDNRKFVIVIRCQLKKGKKNLYILYFYFLCPTIVFILTGLLGSSVFYSPIRPLYIKFCVHSFKIYSLILETNSFLFYFILFYFF